MGDFNKPPKNGIPRVSCALASIEQISLEVRKVAKLPALRLINLTNHLPSERGDYGNCATSDDD